MDRLHRFVNLLSVATADGRLTEREILFLSERAREWGLNDHQFAIAVNRSLEHPGEFEIPGSRTEREELLRDMLSIMAADGRLQDVEKQLFAIVAAHMDFSAPEIDAIIVDLAANVAARHAPTASSSSTNSGDKSVETAESSGRGRSVGGQAKKPSSQKAPTKKAKKKAAAKAAPPTAAKTVAKKNRGTKKAAANKSKGSATSQARASKKSSPSKKSTSSRAESATSKAKSAKPKKPAKKSASVASRAQKKGRRK